MGERGEMTYRKGRSSAVELLRSALIFHAKSVVAMLEDNPVYRVAFEQLEGSDFIPALPLVGHGKTGEWIAQVIAQKCPNLRTNVVDALLRFGNAEAAQKIIDEFLVPDDYSYYLVSAAWWYAKYGIGENLLKKQAKKYPWCVQQVIESYSPDEQERLWKVVGIVITE